MPVITQLASQKRKRERISVFVDDKFFCGLSFDDVLKHSLVTGMEVSDEFLSNLLTASGENEMYNKVLLYILRSPRTETEIRRYLSQKRTVSPDMTTRIIDRLKTMNYINDEAYAQMFTAAKHVKTSARAIKQKLKQKGVASNFIDMATQDIGDQSLLTRAVAEKYMRNKEYTQKHLNNLLVFLIRKGFDYDIVTEIVGEYKRKGEVDPELLNEYQQAKEQLRLARAEAWQKKRTYKELKKKLVAETE